MNGLRRMTEVEIMRAIGRARTLGAAATVSALWCEVRRRRGEKQAA